MRGTRHLGKWSIPETEMHSRLRDGSSTARSSAHVCYYVWLHSKMNDDCCNQRPLLRRWNWGTVRTGSLASSSVDSMENHSSKELVELKIERHVVERSGIGWYIYVSGCLIYFSHPSPNFKSIFRRNIDQLWKMKDDVLTFWPYAHHHGVNRRHISTMPSCLIVSYFYMRSVQRLRRLASQHSSMSLQNQTTPNGPTITIEEAQSAAAHSLVRLRPPTRRSLLGEGHQGGRRKCRVSREGNL
jgi:hypothetical protein